MYWVAGLAVLAACTGDPGFCVEQEVSITQGLYGRITYQSDVGRMGPEPRVERVEVLDMPDSTTVVAATTSNADGIFEVELTRGDFALCGTPNEPCVTFSVSPTAPLVRVDLLMSFIGTHWELASRSGCAE